MALFAYGNYAIVILHVLQTELRLEYLQLIKSLKEYRAYIFIVLLQLCTSKMLFKDRSKI